MCFLTRTMVLPCLLNQIGSITITWIELVQFPFLIVWTNLYSRLVSKYLEVILPVALASLIEVNWCTYIPLLFVIGFNTSNVYAILYGALTYGDISICPYLGNQIKSYIRLLILICFFIAHQLFISYYIGIGVQFTIFFQVGYYCILLFSYAG